MKPLGPLTEINVVFEGKVKEIRNNEGLLPPQPASVGGRLNKFVEGWKRITNDPVNDVLSIVTKITDFVLLSLMLQKNAITEMPPDSLGLYSNLFLVHKASGGWLPVMGLKRKSEYSHLCSSLSYVHYKLSSKYRQKRRFRIQDRPAGCVLLSGCVLLCTNTFEQQEVSQVCLQKQGLSIPSTSLRSEHSPSDINLFGAHCARLPPSSGDFGHSLPRRLVSSPSRPPSSILPSVSATEYMLDLVGFVPKKKSDLDLVQAIQFLGVQLCLELGRAFLPESKAREIIACVCKISSQQILSYQAVAQFMGSLNLTSGLIPLGLLP